MKYTLLFCTCLCSLGIRASADAPDTPGRYPQAAIGIGCAVRPVFGQSFAAIIFSTEALLTKHWIVGVKADVTGKKAAGTFGYSVEKPGLSIVTAGLTGGYRQGLGKHFGIEASVLGGITNAALRDRAESRLVYTGKTYVRQYKTVANSTFLVAQPSLAFSYRFKPEVEIKAGVGYDFAAGMSQWTTARDFSGFHASMMLMLTQPQGR